MISTDETKLAGRPTSASDSPERVEGGHSPEDAEAESKDPSGHDRDTEAKSRTGSRRHRVWPRRCAIIALAILLFCAGVLAFAVRNRMDQERRGVGAVSVPGDVRALDGPKAVGAFRADISFTSMATGAATIDTSVAWDDEWFFRDPAEYNHDLATTCSVLSAVANSESAYYQQGSGSPAYMEQALSKLGFEDVSTASYRYRSEIFDEIVDFLTGTDDVVAYSVAKKHISNAKGETKTLFLVSVRGSYGAEWLSDLNMGDASELDLDVMDHEGFARAAGEIVDDLSERITEEAGLDETDDIALLFCGHSRGAATANLAAAYADDMTQSLRPLAPLNAIYCYTFATPELTTATNTREQLYDNIFNILNPSDVVPRLPLASWGYARYGHDLSLPGYGDDYFDERYRRMQETFEDNTGVECPYDPSDRERVDALAEDLGREIATADGLASFGGIGSLVKGLMMDVDIVRVLYGHYPSVYIAWMQAIDANVLTANS